MFQSGGVLVKAPDTVLFRGTTDNWGRELPFWWASYAEMYLRHNWVATVVDKLANLTARLPVRVYEIREDGRPELPEHPYARLLARPSPRLSTAALWRWVSSTKDIYGEAFLLKVRDNGGRPVELIPLHPTAMHEEDDGTWRFEAGKVVLKDIRRRDLIHFKDYNPRGGQRGMSKLEPLRATLENEAGARAAQSAVWRQGGRPSLMLRHPGRLSEGAIDRLATQMHDIHGGVDNWAKTLITEEGIDATVLPINFQDLEYIQTRTIDRDEIIARYDVPPPAVHVLERATFSNITEQNRALYRDTMDPRLADLEATLDLELRDGRFGEDVEPDFSEGIVAEFWRDAVLQGSPEQRAQSHQQAIHSGWMTPAEVRRKENLPFLEGSDRLFINSTLVPILTAEGEPEEGLPEEVVRSLMGRLSRPQTLSDIDAGALTAGLNGHSGLVVSVLEAAKAAGESVPQFRARIAGLRR